MRHKDGPPAAIGVVRTPWPGVAAAHYTDQAQTAGRPGERRTLQPHLGRRRLCGPPQRATNSSCLAGFAVESKADLDNL